MLKRLLILLIVPFILCSCSKKSVEEIKFSSWGSITETQILNHLISEYEKENPDVKINFIHIPQNYFQKLHLLFASSTAPDVIFINNLYLPLYTNHLEDLSGIINPEDYYPQSLAALSKDGKLYAIPRDISNFVFFYNKNITGEINSDWTFEDFEKLIKQISSFEHFGVSYERDIYKASPYTITLGFDNGVAFYKKLEGKYAPTPAQTGSSTQAQMFLNGKIGLYLSGRWMYPKISENANFPYGIVTFPGTVSSDASGWAVSKNSKHKNQAVKFVRYLSSKGSIDYFTQSGLIVPARIDSSKNIKEQAFLEAINKSVPNNVDKNFSKTRDELNKKLFN